MCKRLSCSQPLILTMDEPSNRHGRPTSSSLSGNFKEKIIRTSHKVIIETSYKGNGNKWRAREDIGSSGRGSSGGNYKRCYYIMMRGAARSRGEAKRNKNWGKRRDEGRQRAYRGATTMWILQTITCLLIFSNFGNSDITDNIKYPQPYQFGYTVIDETTGDLKNHQEVNDGKEVRGRYSLVEPTGDLRVVTYTADRDNGFRAVVNVEPRTQTQPTPTYHLVKLQPLQKLTRQHDATVMTVASVTPDIQQNERENDKPSLIDSEFENRFNSTGNEQMMAVIKDFPSPDKNVSQSEYSLGDREMLDKKPFNIEHLISEGPQIIPVKIEEDISGIGSEIQEPVLKINGSIKPVISVEVENKTGTLQTDEQDKIDVSTPNSQVKIDKNDSQPSFYSSQVKNTTFQQSVLKSMLELYSNKQSTLQPSLDNLFTTMGYYKTSEYQPLQTENPDLKQLTSSKTKESEEIKEKSKNNTNDFKVTSNHEDIKMSDLKQNNMMLAALLLPTTPILKFTCTPDPSDKNNMDMTPTMPDNKPYPVSLGPAGSVFTPSIPILPFQIVNFSPIKQIFTIPQNNKLIPQTPTSPFSTKLPFATAFPTALFQNTGTTVGTAPYQTKNIAHKDELVKNNPPNGYTNLRTEGSASQAHKVQSSHYTHHLLPPPWVPHPLRPSHNSHYRHIPIFVLPMSHNFNFAPTFDPSLIDKHNH